MFTDFGGPLRGCETLSRVRASTNVYIVQRESCDASWGVWGGKITRSMLRTLWELRLTDRNEAEGYV